jgi:hypothetical protein
VAGSGWALADSAAGVIGEAGAVEVSVEAADLADLADLAADPQEAAEPAEAGS